MEEKLVSVIVITYQHKRYIRKALDSVLSQNVNFSIEIIVADDCSTDGTRDILIEYKRKYKEKLKVILRKKNIGATRNYYAAQKKASGKYIICLEGDDYWTDNDKLKKQVHFLENHPEFVGVFHKCHVIDEHDRACKMLYEDMYTMKSVYTMKDFEKGKLPGHTATFMYKNLFKEKDNIENIIYKLHPLVGDQTMYGMLLAMGNFGFIDADMSVYRIVEKRNGTSASSIAKNNNVCFSMWKYYCDLETSLYARFNIKVSFDVQRKRELNSAKNRFLENLEMKDLVILVKIAFLNKMWIILQKWRSLERKF